MHIGTAQTWAYINAQLDFKRRYAVHIVGEDGGTLCKHGGILDESSDEELTWEWFQKYDWACKLCKRIYARQLAAQARAQGKMTK